MKNYLYKFLAHFWKICTHRTIQLSLLLLIIFGSTTPNLLAGTIDPGNHGTGARILTEEQRESIEKDWPRVLGVHPNKYGILRMNDHLKKMNQGEISIETALTFEDEFITNKNYDRKSGEKLWGLVSLPPSVDNSKLACFPPIGDQKEQSSCVGWATTYYHATHEYGLLNGLNNKASSSGIRSPKWTYNMINFGEDEGSYPTDGYDLLAKNGSVSITEFPYNTNYTEWDLKIQDWISAISYRMGSPQFLNINGSQDIEIVKQILNNGHILTFTTYAYSWVFTKVKSDPASINNQYAGQYAISWMNGSSGGHHLTIVGYDDNVWIDVNGNGKVDAGEKGAFLVANSWGTDWANNGFVWISYDAFFNTSKVSNGPSSGRLQIADMIYSIVAKAPHYSPKLIAKFTVTQAKRDQLNINAGASERTVTQPAIRFVNGALSRSGGPLAFDGGSARNMTATFALDLTDLLPETIVNHRYYLTAEDVVLGNTTTLNKFSLVDLTNNNEVANTTTPLNVDKSIIKPYIDYKFSNVNQDTLPVIAITSPVNDSTVKGVINITANVTNNVEASRVDFYVDTTLIASDTTSPFMTTLDTKTLSNGSHTLMAMAYNSSGDYTQNVVDIVVQNIALTESVLINAGGPSVIDPCTNITWQADTFYTGGTTYVNPNFPTYLGMYRSERFGKFSYNIPVTNGNKLVTLRFAELYHKAVGKRIFHVNINGIRMISNLDVYKEAGFGNPYERSFDITVTNNNVKVDFIPVIENPKINAIGIFEK